MIRNKYLNTTFFRLLFLGF